MADFFKSTSSNAFSEKGFPNSKTSSSSLRSNNNVNMTKNSHMPVVTQLNQDVTISPLSKEIDSRLKVLNKILPHDEVVQLSQDFINRLNSACFDKIAETVCSGSNLAASSAYGGASSVCSSMVSQRINYQNRPLTNGNEVNKEPVTQLMYKSARNVRLQNDLEIINEEPRAVGLTTNSSREKPRSKNQTQAPIKSASVVPSHYEDDSMCFRKPANPTHGRKQRSNLKKNDSSTFKLNSRKKKTADEGDMSTESCDLTITRTSLRSNAGSKRNSESVPKQKTTAKKSKKDILAEEMDQNSRYDNENPKQNEENSAFMLKIQSRPKKTALSPFFNRFKQRCSAGKTTSTPFKL